MLSNSNGASPQSLPNLRQRPTSAGNIAAVSRLQVPPVMFSPPETSAPQRNSQARRSDDELNTSSASTSSFSSTTNSSSDDSDVSEERQRKATGSASTSVSGANVVITDKKIMSLPPPSPSNPEHQSLLVERVHLDTELLTLWTRITTLVDEVVTHSESALPDEHSRALAAQKEQMMLATPQVINSIHETLTITNPQDTSRRSPSLNSEMSSRRSNSGRGASPSEFASSMGTSANVTTKAMCTLDLVDSFRDDAELLSRHYLESLFARYQRKEGQLEEVRKSNAAMTQQLKKLSDLANRKAEEAHVVAQREAKFRQEVVRSLMMLATECASRLQRHDEENRYLDEEIICGVEVSEDRTPSSVQNGPYFLFFEELRADAARRVLAGYGEFLEQDEPETERVERYKLKIAEAYHPEAFVGPLEQRIAEITAKKEAFEAEIHPFATYVTEVFVEENQSKMRKTERRSVSPMAPGRTASGSASARSISPCVPLSELMGSSTTVPPVPVQPASIILPASLAQPSGCNSRGRSPIHFDFSQPDTARTASSSVLPLPNTGRPTTAASVSSRSPSRREAVFRSNGMIHVPTSEAAVELLVVPRPASCLNARTQGGELLPSLKTLLVRRDRLKKLLLEAQDKSKRELKAQLSLLEKDRALARQRETDEKRRREAVAKQKILPSSIGLSQY